MTAATDTKPEALGFTPVGNRIIAESVEEAEEVRASGLVLPESARKRPTTYRVLAMGPDVADALPYAEDMVGNPVTIHAGDLLYVSPHAAIPIDWDEDRDLVVLDPKSIIGVVDQPS